MVVAVNEKEKTPGGQSAPGVPPIAPELGSVRTNHAGTLDADKFSGMPSPAAAPNDHVVVPLAAVFPDSSWGKKTNSAPTMATSGTWCGLMLGAASNETT